MNKQEDCIQYSQDDRELIEAFIEYSFGEISYIIHEQNFEDIQFDFAVIEPTEHEDYYKIVSIGGGAYEMDVPSAFPKGELERAELVMLLPKDSFDINDRGSLWSICRMLVILQMPLHRDSWIGFGHTFSDGTPLIEGTEMKTICLVTACDRHSDVMRLETGDKIVNFYQMIPMYDEEVRFKQRTDMCEFLNQLHEEDFPPMFDVKRQNRCKQRVRDKGMEMLH